MLHLIIGRLLYVLMTAALILLSHFISCFNLVIVLFSLQEKIDLSTDVLKEILKPVVDDGAEEIHWPPRNPEALNLMQKVCFLFPSWLEMFLPLHH